MPVKLHTSMLSEDQRVAVYSLLFAAAFADDELHRGEIEVIIASMGGIDGESLRIRQAIREIVRSQPPLEESFRRIRTGPGDIAVIVSILMIEVVAADGNVAIAEVRFLRRIIDQLDIINAGPAGTSSIVRKLNSLLNLVPKTEGPVRTGISELIELFAGASNMSDLKTPDRGGPGEAVDAGDACLNTVLMALRHRRKRDRTGSAVQKFI